MKKLSILEVKIIHSLIWVVMVAAIFYTLFSGVTGRINWLTFFSVGLIFLETFVLVVNKWACPLTIIAKRTKSDWKDGDDIFLPKWLAKHNKEIFGTIFLIGFSLVIMRLVLVIF